MMERSFYAGNRARLMETAAPGMLARDDRSAWDAVERAAAGVGIGLGEGSTRQLGHDHEEPEVLEVDAIVRDPIVYVAPEPLPEEKLRRSSRVRPLKRESDYAASGLLSLAEEARSDVCFNQRWYREFRPLSAEPDRGRFYAVFNLKGDIFHADL